MMQAAAKAVPLGQAAGQRMRAALADAMPAAADHAIALPESAWQNAAPMLAILSAREGLTQVVQFIEKRGLLQAA
jgi:urease accessory protein